MKFKQGLAMLLVVLSFFTLPLDYVVADDSEPTPQNTYQKLDSTLGEQTGIIDVEVSWNVPTIQISKKSYGTWNLDTLAWEIENDVLSIDYGGKTYFVVNNNSTESVNVKISYAATEGLEKYSENITFSYGDENIEMPLNVVEISPNSTQIIYSGVSIRNDDEVNAADLIDLGSGTLGRYTLEIYKKDTE